MRGKGGATLLFHTGRRVAVGQTVRARSQRARGGIGANPPPHSLAPGGDYKPRVAGVNPLQVASRGRFHFAKCGTDFHQPAASLHSK